jgi:hypothetical protein
VNVNLFERNWKEIRNHATSWWSLMSDFDLVKIDKTEAKFDKFTTMLQVKYGYTRDQAKKEIIKHIAEFDVDKKDRIKPA